jgi:hypothetical protein
VPIVAPSFPPALIARADPFASAAPPLAVAASAAPRAPAFADRAPSSQTAMATALDVPFDGARRRRKVAVVFALLLLLFFGGLLGAMIWSRVR